MHASNLKELADAVRAAGDIVRLVSEYVPLKPAGKRLKGLCPFHQEKTPSFSVDPANQLFYCFGCQTGGDVFKFVQLYERVDFRGSVDLLAQKWGVRIPPSRPGSSDGVKERVLEMNAAATAFFAARLHDPDTGAACRSYLATREVGPETVARLGLGYAPAGWDGLRSHLLRRFKPAEMLEAGLVIARRDSRGEYDRFRDRLMFPIRDVSGRTVAFGGRCLDGSDPKYLNSPETPAYNKGSHLYGLDRAKDAIRKAGAAVVVEGYLDLAALLQAGFEHGVASLGTAFTPEQARLLARFTSRVIVSYDGDPAGDSAAARSLDLLLEKGFDVRVAELPEGLDPDDFLRRHGREGYGKILENAPGYLEFLLRREARTRDLSVVSEKVAAVNALLPRVARLESSIERMSWAGRIADLLQVEDGLVLQELRSALRERRGRIAQSAAEHETVRAAEAVLVSSLLAAGDGWDPAELGIDEEDLGATRVAGIVGTILRLRAEGSPAGYPLVFEALENDADRELLTRIAFREASEPGIEDLSGCVKVLRRERLVRERGKLQREIEKAADPRLVDALLVRKQELGKQIDALS